MFSFKSLALTAAIAFGAFTTAFAAPTIGADIASIAERDVSVRSVAVILADVTVKVTPIVAELGKFSLLFPVILMLTICPQVSSRRPTLPLMSLRLSVMTSGEYSPKPLLRSMPSLVSTLVSSSPMSLVPLLSPLPNLPKLSLP